MPPKKKKKMNSNSLANLNNSSEAKSVEEEFNPHIHLDSSKPIWEEETDDEESQEPEVIIDSSLWSGEALRKSGVYDEMVEAAELGEKSYYFFDYDSEDEDWLPPKEKFQKDRKAGYRKGVWLIIFVLSNANTQLVSKERKYYAKGPDVSRKAPRTQRRYKKAWAGQTNLDSFVQVVQGREGLPLGVPNCEIRTESVTPPPLTFDENFSDDKENPPTSRPESPIAEDQRHKRFRSEDSDESESVIDDAGLCGESELDSEAESWEEELEEVMITVSKADIRPWDVLRTQIEGDIKKSLKTKKVAQSQLNQLMTLRGFATLRLRGLGKIEASKQVAQQWQNDVQGSAVSFARRIRSLATYYQLHEQLPPESRGGYQNARSLLKDEAVRNACRAWLTSQKIGTVTPYRFCDGLNSDILPSLNISLKKPLCYKTALRWLVKLGWSPTKLKKGVYMDGHERDDVVQYRKTVYLPKITEYQRRMKKYEGPNLKCIEPELAEGEKEIIAIFQDESCCNANEYRTTAW